MIWVKNIKKRKLFNYDNKKSIYKDALIILQSDLS